MSFFIPTFFTFKSDICRQKATFTQLAKHCVRCSSTLMLLASLAGLILMPNVRAESLKLGGTGSALGTMQMMVDSLQKKYPDFSATIVPNLGSGGGLKALVAQAIDLAVISRPLTIEEIAQGLVAVEYGRTPFVFATNQKNISNISLQEATDIIGRKVTTWRDGTPIRLILRPATDYDTFLLAKFSSAMKSALENSIRQEGVVIASTDQDSANELERLPGSFGTTSVSLLVSEKRPLHILSLDNVQPTVAALANNRYPYCKTMSIVTRGEPSALAKRFIDYLYTPVGQSILKQTGHVVSPRILSVTRTANAAQ